MGDGTERERERERQSWQDRRGSWLLVYREMGQASVEEEEGRDQLREG